MSRSRPVITAVLSITIAWAISGIVAFGSHLCDQKCKSVTGEYLTTVGADGCKAFAPSTCGSTSYVMWVQKMTGGGTCTISVPAQKLTWYKCATGCKDLCSDATGGREFEPPTDYTMNKSNCPSKGTLDRYDCGGGPGH